MFHKFVVFSELDAESDSVIVHYANCDNCGATHKIFDLCKSEIVVGTEDVTVVSITDFKLSLPSELYDTLNQYGCGIADFQHAQNIIDNKNWGSHIVLKREELDGKISGKILTFVEENKYRIESYLHNEYA